MRTDTIDRFRRARPRQAGHIFRMVGLLGALALVWPAAAAAQAGCADLAPALPRVQDLQVGAQQSLRLPVPAERVAVGDPNVADVQMVGTHGFLLTGIGAGTTSLMVWTRCARDPVKSVLMVAGPAAVAVHERVPPREARAELPAQVQTDIRLVEVSRNKLREAGISLLGRRASSNFLVGSPEVLGGQTFSPGTFGTISPGITAPEAGFNIFYGGGGRNFLALLNALEGSGFAYTLAEPSLVALSGQKASFLAGGEFPIPVPSGRGDSVTIEFKEFGVRLSLTPTVVDRDRIMLKVAPEVSELDFQAGIRLEGTSVPALRVRRTDTTVALADGESFVLSGLVSSSTIASVDKLPGLGTLPVLGAFFRSSRFEAEDRELLMIVTPRLVRPLAADAELPELPGRHFHEYDPSFAELFLFEDGSFSRRMGLWD
ncbi:Type II/IV secretion system secretin RcpA/CpaC, associated with Flp pilus assembly [Thioalkalivibrio nitratireducens DSM 14787]|uniref:Type II/IV secretion system secretin RcpA/CpaC, associated with Flp pilus assembly n=1 Tax=Thioalkalivibrio nitratireducens (strain DSM 14787 / UNIQEM 213 / ALEN2) TaxID=1255043 RepID=L0DYV3_THIND|nr:type II and III secretion system protein family protein [Thioalkalivibrio nitratireducens]AGA34145.1 Type II/IV secretion system secretin RcpA/CpaC, associated with Flp pilus assembly [Thioalkalivibrio nitratireducens DSM 14787]